MRSPFVPSQTSFFGACPNPDFPFGSALPPSDGLHRWGNKARGWAPATASVHLSPKALRDSNVRPPSLSSSAPTHNEQTQWRKVAMVFLTSCLLEAEDEEAKSKLPKKIERLSSYYLLHACDWQLQGQGLPGYMWYFPSIGPQLPVERRPLLIENMDSGSQNV